ncbi:hypothetical protein GF373_17525 [bacterium]|nr:hypothetical protein [bacterium]
MKKLTIILLIIATLLISGCGAKEYREAKAAEKQAEQQLEEMQDTADKMEAQAKDMERIKEEADSETRTVKETTTGDSVTFKKLPDYTRDKGAEEVCDMDYPFECSDYLAKNGIIYLTIKNIGYESKVDEVTLYLNDDSCDPMDTYIETGQIKEFECYVSPNAEFVSGELKVEYYTNIKKLNEERKGELAVLME